MSKPTEADDFLRMRLSALAHEEFYILWLDERHRLIECQKLFTGTGTGTFDGTGTGTFDGTGIYPCELLHAALSVNACAAMSARNQASGVAEPGAADRAITHELRDALRLIGVRILGHIVMGAECISVPGGGAI